VYNGYCT
jgi:hypothetical protein